MGPAGTGRDLRVFVVDAALFTLPYDTHFCQALAARGVDVDLIGRRLRPNESQPQMAGYRFKPHFYPLSERGRAASSGGLKLLKGIEHGIGLQRLAAGIAQERPDIVHFQWLALPPFDRLFLAHVKRFSRIVMTVHNSVAFHGSKHASKLQVMGELGALLQFQRYIVHTEKTRAYLRSLEIPNERIHLLPHPPLSLSHEKQTQIAKTGPVRILFFGSIKAYKGVDTLIEAALKLAERNCKFRIEIAGRPFMPMDGLIQKIDASGHADLFDLDLRFLPDDDLSACLDRADLVVFPYRSIDASGAFAVAVDHGVPIIATDVGVFSEGANRDYLTLVEPGNADQLADCMEAAIIDSELRATMRKKIEALRSISINWDDFAQGAIDVYRTTTGTPSAIV